MKVYISSSVLPVHMEQWVQAGKKDQTQGEQSAFLSAVPSATSRSKEECKRDKQPAQDSKLPDAVQLEARNRNATFFSWKHCINKLRLHRMNPVLHNRISAGCVSCFFCSEGNKVRDGDVGRGESSSKMY